MTRPSAALAARALLLLASVLLAACSGAASGSAPPSGSPIAISTADQAAQRVIQVEPGFSGIEARDPKLIGACCFYAAVQVPEGFQVTFEVGAGDCPAGCIQKHRWTYGVTRDGVVTLLGDTGDELPAGAPGPRGSPGTGGGILPGGTGIQGRAAAGPTCPVQRPGDSSCNDRPVAGAAIAILDASGHEVARVTTDADGRYAVTLPAGPYTVEPQPVQGLMRTPGTVAATVSSGYATVDLAYDTGIR